MGFLSMTRREAEAMLLRGVMLTEEECIARKVLRGESISREEEQQLGFNSYDSSDGEDLLPASETRRKRFASPVSVVHFEC